MAGEVLTLGVDLGGTKILTALVRGGEVVTADRRATDVDGGFDAVVAQIAAAARACREQAGGAEAAAVGVGVAGQVAAGTGVVSNAPNLGWEDAPLRSALEDALDVPVTVLNDVRAAAWGEWRHGAGVGSSEVTVVFVGTGIGGSVVSGGRMLTGATNMAGELGHMTVSVGGRRCHCGNRGCLEAYAGGWAIAERAREAVASDPDAGEALVRQAGGLAGITAETVYEVRATGDPLAVRLVEETALYLGAGMVAVVNAFNPRDLVLGGGVIDHAPFYVERVRAYVRDHALEAGAEGLRVKKAELGEEAGALGAATYAYRTNVDSKGTGTEG